MSRPDSEGFTKAMDIGKVAEEAVLRFYWDQGAEIEDLRSDPNAWRQDIDFIINGKTVDVKADTHAPVNLFLSDSYSNGKVGRFWGSRAEVWIYVFTTGDALLLPLPKLQKYVAERYQGLRRVEGRGMMEGRSVMGDGLLVPIHHVVAALGIERFTLSLD